MLNRIIGNIKEHPVFFIAYSIFLIALLVILFNYSKTESLIIVNHSWSSFQDVFFKYCTYLGDGIFALITYCFCSYIGLNMAFLQPFVLVLQQ